MSLISVSIVNVALSSIQQELGASSSALQWVLTGYALAFGVLLVASGRAGDVFGRRKLFIAGSRSSRGPRWCSVSRPTPRCSTSAG
nr:MFS transporter [Kocuria sp.]